MIPAAVPMRIGHTGYTKYGEADATAIPPANGARIKSLIFVLVWSKYDIPIEVVVHAAIECNIEIHELWTWAEAD